MKKEIGIEIGVRKEIESNLFEPILTNGVTKWVCEKIAHDIAQPIFVTIKKQP
jgi:hypothetical protein